MTGYGINKPTHIEQSSDVDVTLEVTDPDNQVSDADINIEKQQIGKQIDRRVIGFGIQYGDVAGIALR